jgi:hypothetical protein
MLNDIRETVGGPISMKEDHSNNATKSHTKIKAYKEDHSNKLR